MSFLLTHANGRFCAQIDLEHERHYGFGETPIEALESVYCSIMEWNCGNRESIYVIGMTVDL